MILASLTPETPGAGAPAPASAPAPEDRPGSAVRAWVVLVTNALAKAYCVFLATLAVIALAPALWGWSSYIVRSGSMEPSISTGDVVVASPLAPDAGVPVGRVMVFINPARPGATELLIHRVVARASDGSFTTAGDANATTDSTTVPRSSFLARGRLLIPDLALPIVWFAAGKSVPLTGWLVLVAASFTLFAFPLGERRTRRRWRSGRPPTVPVTGSVAHCIERPAPWTATRFGRAGLALALVLASGDFIVRAGAATAAFSAPDRNSGNTWAVQARILQPYTTQVLADSPYLYYLLDESSGSVAADNSGNGRTGTYTAVSAYRQGGGLPNNPGDRKSVV